MKISVFSTQTTHHAWFVYELMKYFKDILCVLEEEALKPPFPTHHQFEHDRDQYERAVLLNNQNLKIPDLVNCIQVNKINYIEENFQFEEYKTDVIIVFGTNKINRAIINKYKGRIINLHGGDPEFYRGLDSHLWTIYHEDFINLVTTLHHLNENLDDGEIIAKKTLDLGKIDNICQLRTLNTRACFDLTINALCTYNSSGMFHSSKQQCKGRYYSFMPATLKEVCCKKFNKYIARNAD
jgi:methionyl-tRNA formyltransferase